MARHCFPHRRNCLRKLCYSFEFPKFLRACVIRVVDILPPSRRVFTDRLHSALGCRIDRDFSPRRWNSKIVDSIEVGFRETPTHGLVAKPSLRITKTTYADVLQALDCRHGYRNGI